MRFKTNLVFRLILLTILVSICAAKFTFLQSPQDVTSTRSYLYRVKRAEGDELGALGGVTKDLEPGNKPEPNKNEPDAKKAARQKLKEEKMKAKLDRANKSKENRQKQADDLAAQAFEANLEDQHSSKFEVKHLFDAGKQGGVNSFEKLTTDEKFAKRYFVDMDRKLLNHGILPYEEDLASWLSTKGDDGNPTSKRVSIVDAPKEELNQAVSNDPNFKNWQATKPRETDSKFILTDNKYQVTTVVFEPIITENGKISGVVMKATQYEGQVKLSADRDGKMTHFEGIIDSKMVQSETKIGTFTVEELKTNGQLKRELLKILEIPETSTVECVLDTENPKFKEAAKQLEERLVEEVIETRLPLDKIPSAACRSGSRRRKRTICAVYLSEDGSKVESIDAKRFEEAYRNANDAEKRQLTEYVKNNGDKINVYGGDGIEARRTLNELVHAEEFKAHVNTIDKVHEVQDIERWGGCGLEKQSEMLDKMHGKLKAVGGNKIKISCTKFAETLSESKLFKGGTHAVGVGFLAHGIITGIIHNDTTSLAIIGGRLGYDVATDGVVAFGSKFINVASKAGKFARFLGKVAGPIGSVIDIGLSAYSLTKAVERLDTATNKYDRDDAIADIVADSVSIAVTATTTILSIAFPPLAPVFMLVGLVIDILNRFINSVVHAVDEVNKIDAEIPLSENERVYEIVSRVEDIFGIRKKDYLDYLFEEKQANDLAVQHNLWFLGNNTDFAGIVFPSRTLHYDGGCTLTKTFCKCDLGLFGCAGWEETETWGTGCDWGRPCDYNGNVCTDHTQSVPGSTCGYDQLNCHCSDPSTEFDNYPRLNQIVNFSRKETIYWERAVPKDVEDGVFKCKPGLDHYVHYTLTQDESREDYLCEAAIGLLQPSDKRKENQMMLFDLEAGADQVRLADDDHQTNMFRMGDEGDKDFKGGASSTNIFLFDEDCSKLLRGKIQGGERDSDTIVVTDKCASDNHISFDFTTGRMKSSNETIDIEFTQIEEVDGRKGESEKIIGDCSVRKLILRGGKEDKPDEIHLKSSSCPYNVTIVASEFTDIISDTKEGNITVVMDKLWNRVTLKGDVYSGSDHRLQVIFSTTASHQVQLVEPPTITADGMDVSLKSVETGDTVKFSFTFPLDQETSEDSRVMLNFPEENLSSVLMISKPRILLYHHLPNGNESRRETSNNIPSLFDIIGSGWHAIGSAESDQFVLHTMDVFVDGGDGEDTVILHDDITHPISLDLRTDPKVINIESVIGSKTQKTKVFTSCSTKLVTVHGTTHPDEERDEVIVTPDPCAKKELQILAKGQSTVTIEDWKNFSEDDMVTVIASVDDTSSQLDFTLFSVADHVDSIFATVFVQTKDWRVTSFDPESVTGSQLVSLEAPTGDKVGLSLRKGITKYPSSYLPLPTVQFKKRQSSEPPATLLFREDTNKPSMRFVLNNLEQTDDRMNLIVQGYTFLENTFHILNNSWNAIGGNENDVFFVTTNSPKAKVTLNGGGGQDNLLILQNGDEAVETGDLHFTVNLDMEKIGYWGMGFGSIKSIQHVIGRQNTRDIITAGCDTKSISGGGGTDSNNLDILAVHECDASSSRELLLEIGKFTEVRNLAKRGQYTYIVHDFLTSEIRVDVTRENSHLLRFQFDPVDQIKYISFNKTSEKLHFDLNDDKKLNQSLHAYHMSRVDTNADYKNPVFQFHSQNSTFTREIRVTREGTVVATSVIRDPPSSSLSLSSSVLGVPAETNLFLINSTNDDKGSRDEYDLIRGYSEGKVNQFWIFSLETQVNHLDGGSCETSPCSTNYLNLAESFKPGEIVEINVKSEIDSGLSINGNKFIKSITNIHVIQGRSSENSHDIAYLNCKTRSISKINMVKIGYPSDDEECVYDLVIGVDKGTHVFFEGPDLNKNYTRNITQLHISSVIHYKFDEPRNFDLEGDPLGILGPTHNFYLPFTLDDLEDLRFAKWEDCLYYKVKGTEYSISMVYGPLYGEQFYSQPVMITRDYFQIQVNRHGSILLSLGAASRFGESRMSTLVVSLFEKTAQRLGVTIVVQTDSEFLHVGHKGEEGGRQVLQNVGHSASYLVAGGGVDTIYEIVKLSSDVFIYPGIVVSGSMH